MSQEGAPEALEDPDQVKAVLRGLEAERLLRASRSRVYGLFPDEGPLRRGLYPKHMEFFRAGARHQERALLGGNRTGKTMGVSYEVTCHAIGWYPHWWDGRRFSRPISIWACGEDAKAVRESLQETYLGKPEQQGTGLIPWANIIDTTARGGVPDAVDSITIRTAWGGSSRMVFKTYDQGRESYQGAEVDIVQFDEEPPKPIYSEGLTRTMSTKPGQPSGLVVCGFTPLKGLSPVALDYLPGGVLPSTELDRKQAWGW